MIFSLGETNFETDKSIIVAGIRATGKSHLIKLLQKYSTVKVKRRRRPPSIVHREVTENSGIPPESLIHWPIAEKHAGADGLSYENVGVVILLNKRWEDYCYNVNKRGQTTQYSVTGFEQISKQWEDFFQAKKLPILFVKSNRVDIPRLIADMAEAVHHPFFL